MKTALKIDKFFLLSIILLTLAGFFVFSSASLGLLARDGASFQNVVSKQLISLFIGIVGFLIISNINYRLVRKNSFYIFLFAIFLNLLLFIPSISFTHGGASRWIDLGFITFQPGEFLKISFIIYFATWLSMVKEKVASFSMGVIPYLSIVGILGILLYFQSDMDTLIVIAFTGIIMLFISGGRMRDIFTLFIILTLVLSIIAISKPYIINRITSFLDPMKDSQSIGYQVQQSLIAIGSGQINGRGFGQSVQKFKYLPEPIGDSIFAVWAEEFGFLGSITLIILFLLFIFSSFRIAVRSKDIFARLASSGIAILIIIESFMNISSMLGIIPISGMPLLFISHGGTALIVILCATGIIANISKYQNT